MTDHYADAVFSEPGRCWRMVQKPGVGARTRPSVRAATTGRVWKRETIEKWARSTGRDILEA
jgi:hypothetical protein